MTAASATRTAPPRWEALTAKRVDRFIWGFLAAVIVIRGALALHAIGRPGLQMDETLFVNASTLRIPNLFLLHSLGGVPLMVFPYIGALKSWLYDPLFALFGTSPAVIRTPVVVIASVGLLLTYFAVRDLANRPVALLAFTTLCFDSSVFWLTRDDVGPSSIEFALKCAALFFAARFARAPRLRWLVLLLVALGLGVFNKLNFIWVVDAAVVVSVVVAVRHRSALREFRRFIWVWVIGLVVIYVPFGIYYVADNISASAGRAGGFQPWTLFEQGMSGVLAGTWYYDYALTPLNSHMVVVWIVLAAFAAGTIASVAMSRTRNFAIAMTSLAALLMALQCLGTAQATAGWHYISVYPFVTIVGAYGVWALARLTLKRDVSVWLAVAAAAAVALVYNGSLMAKYLDAEHREPLNSMWSPAIYTLSRDLQHNHANIITADWGIFNPLFALHPSPRYTELAFELESPVPANLTVVGQQLAAIPQPKLVVTHAAGKFQFPQDNADLFKAAGPHLHLDYAVKGLDGRPVYDVYTYR
jgi:hypothetical protein